MSVIAIIAILADTVALVADINDEDDISDETKFSAVCDGVASIIDERLDDVPVWSTLSEIARDRIIAGIVEIAVAIYHKTHVAITPKTRFVKLTRVRLIDRMLSKVSAKLEKK